MRSVNMTLSFLLIFVFLTKMGHGCTSMNGISRKAVLMGMDTNLKAKDQQNIEETLKRLSESSSDGGQQNYGNVMSGQVHDFNSVLKQNESQSAAMYLSQRNKNLPHLENETVVMMGEGKLIGFNMTYHELKKTLEGGGHNHGRSQIMWSPYYRPNNTNNTDVHWFYPQQKNYQYPIQVQSLTKSSEYIGFKFLNISDSGENTTVKTSDFLSDSVEMVDDTEPKRRKDSQLNPAVENLTLGPESSSPTASEPPNNIEEEEVFDPQEDEKVNKDWGGNCTVKHWKACYNITVMGDPTEINPLFPNDKKKNKRTQLDCFDTMEAKYFPWLCLRNGWTVNRCHLLCMAQKCNKQLLETRKWDFYVLHEGGCKTK